MNLRFVLLILGLIPLSWLLMQASHEFGHVLAANATGTTVERVVLSPLTFSRTDCERGPFHRIIVFSGAIAGCVLPLATWAVAAALRSQYAFILRFLAGFCLVANGAYIGGDFSVTGPTDAGELFALGVPRAVLIGFGIAAVASGLFLWNGQASNFGWGAASKPIRLSTIWAIWGLLIVVVALEFIYL